MTKISSAAYQLRRERKKVKARNAAILERRKVLRELASSRPLEAPTSPRGIPPSPRVSPPVAGTGGGASRASADAYSWFRDREARAPASPRSSETGWRFLAACGWLAFDDAQAEALEVAFVKDARRLCRVPAGRNLLARASVDFDRMLLLDPALPEFAAVADVLPAALPVRRRGPPRAVRLWRYGFDDENPELPFDDDDSEVLSLAARVGRPCCVLYCDSMRAVVVDVAAGQWGDALYALGEDDDAGDLGGAVAVDAAAAAAPPPPGDAEAPVAIASLVAQLVAMGFDDAAARGALARNGSDVGAAALDLVGS